MIGTTDLGLGLALFAIAVFVAASSFAVATIVVGVIDWWAD